MRITLKDVAARLDLSVGTVSQILNPTSNRTAFFAESTRAQVRQVAEEMGYRPNTAARSTATGRFGAVALLLSHYYYRSLLPPLLLDGISHALDQSDLHLIVSHIPDNRLVNPEVIPKLARELACDGLLINYHGEIQGDMRSLIERHRVPFVWLNSQEKTACVHHDDLGASRSLTQCFLNAGHRKVAYVDYTSGPDSAYRHYSSLDRRRGYEEAMAGAGCEPKIIGCRDYLPLEDRLDFTSRWMNSKSRPSAVVCYTPVEVAAVMETAARLSISVPEQLAPGSFHDQPIQHFNQHLPTAILPEFELGYQAVQMLLKLVAAKAVGGSVRVIRKALKTSIQNPPPPLKGRRISAN